jgi:uncharacterized protein YkwD
MATIETTLALLSAISQLLTFIIANPGIPPEVRANAIRLAEQSIALAQETAVRYQTPPRQPAVPPAPPPTHQNHFRVFEKPVYDLSLLEQITHAMVNEERQRQGLAALELNAALSQVARLHSQDQAQTNRRTSDLQKPCAYPMIRHEGLTDAGFDLGTRLDTARILFRRAAENIALLSTAKNSIYRAPAPIVCPDPKLQEVPRTGPADARKAIIRENISRAEATLALVPTVTWINREWHGLESIARRATIGWIESEGHRANILNPHYIQTGIGVAEVGKYVIITQVFLEPPRGM